MLLMWSPRPDQPEQNAAYAIICPSMDIIKCTVRAPNSLLVTYFIIHPATSIQSTLSTIQYVDGVLKAKLVETMKGH